MLVLHFFPGVPINIPTAALVGMAAMFAGASRAFLTSVVFALETTGQLNGLLPLMGACAAAYFVSFFLMKGSIMTEKIQRRGIPTPDSYEPDILQSATVAQLVQPATDKNDNMPYVYSTDDAGLAAEMMGKYSQDTLLVLDNKKNRIPVGIVTTAAIMAFYSKQKQKDHQYDSPNRTRRLMVQGRKLVNKMRK